MIGKYFSKMKGREILDEVAKHLGNTHTVCKKYYVHPVILDLFETQRLRKYFDEGAEPEKENGFTAYSPEEKVLMKILESHAKTEKVIRVNAA